jgi:hypothetical protein
VRSGAVTALGEGGVGVFFGTGGKIWDGGSTTEYSDESSEGCCDVDSVREDTDVGDELNESSLRGMLSP